MNEYETLTWTLLLITLSFLWGLVGLVIYTAYQSRLNKTAIDSKEKITKAKTINEAIKLCIIEAESNDQVPSYSQGWTAACVYIGEKLGITRDDIISEIKEDSCSKKPPK